MKILMGLVLLVSVAMGWAQEVAPAAAMAEAAPAPAPAALAPPPEVLEPTYLYEVMRHLYRWYMDESDVEQAPAAEGNAFWVRRAEVRLDEGDNSVIVEILLPRLGIAVKVKKADYAIEELGLEVKSRGYRIVNVARVPVPAEPPAGTVVVPVDVAGMKEYLFRTRAQAEFPGPEMFARLRVALLEHLGLDPEHREAGEQVVHVAPLSPVANELWVFWETKKRLIHFSSDVDLENPEMWKNQTLGIRTFDVLTQTVVSLDEAAGSNEFMTRDQIGRALFNCIVLGQRLAVINPPQ